MKEELLTHIERENAKYNKRIKKLFNSLFVTKENGCYRSVLSAPLSCWTEIIHVTRREMIANKELQYCDEDNLLLDYRDVMRYYGDRERKMLFMSEMMDRCNYLLDVKDIFTTLRYLKAPVAKLYKRLEPSVSVSWLRENKDRLNIFLNALLDIKKKEAELIGVDYLEIVEEVKGKYLIFSSLLTPSELQMMLRIKRGLSADRRAKRREEEENGE